MFPYRGMPFFFEPSVFLPLELELRKKSGRLDGRLDFVSYNPVNLSILMYGERILEFSRNFEGALKNNNS